MTIELFPFRYRDARTAKWVHVRYRATVEEIAQRYAVWDITGAPDIRVGKGTMFQPFPFLKQTQMRELLANAPTPEPEIDGDEAALVKLFLGRYVTWCARARHLERIPGAVTLYRSLG